MNIIRQFHVVNEKYNLIMKKLYSTIILTLVCMLGIAQGIEFEHITLDQAVQKAKSENKLVFIDGYAVWCGPCKKMAKTVFMEEEVGQYFDENFVALKVDVERGEGPMIKNKYGISGLPGYVFIDGDGFVVYRFSAAMPTEDFLKEVALAVSYGKDPNSVGRLSERYEAEKNDEKFVRLYLDKLKESKSTNYTDVLEQYLNIQKSIKESDKEMVLLLADHSKEIVFGGKADEIIQRNNGSDAWKLYVRKDIREIFQKIPRSMVESTTNYAIAKRDTAILEVALERAGEAGVKVDDKQRKRIYVYYYSSIGNGPMYKSLVRGDYEVFIQSIDVEDMRSKYYSWKKKKEDGDKEAQFTMPLSQRKSQEIANIVTSYAKFADSDTDKADVIRWMKVAVDIYPDDANILSTYASILYLFSEDKAKAIEIKDKAYQIAKEEGNKRSSGMFEDLQLMKEGEEVSIN